MHYAAPSGNTAVVKWLQSLGLEPRVASGKRQMLPLHWACQHDHVQLVEYFLSLPEAAGDVHARTVTGQTPLHCAADSAADSVVQLLLQRGADVDARDDDCTTPLMGLCSLATVKLLVAAGADATALDTKHKTVLHQQAFNGACAGMICLLLKAGADPTAVDSRGSTPAHVAGMHGHLALQALLSRAADDYRRKHPVLSSTTVLTVSDYSCGANSNSSSSVTSAVGNSSSDSGGSIRITIANSGSAVVLDVEQSDAESVIGVVSSTSDSTTAYGSSTASDNGEHCATTTAGTVDDNSTSSIASKAAAERVDES
eukprot:360-Heterococcus_DN1.PRE.2